jgi:hypothetical protein
MMQYFSLTMNSLGEDSSKLAQKVTLPYFVLDVLGSNLELDTNYRKMFLEFRQYLQKIQGRALNWATNASSISFPIHHLL